MRTAVASRLPGNRTDPEAVIREARRRQRRRYLVTGVAVIVVLAAAAAVITAVSRGGHPRWPDGRPARTAAAPAIRPSRGLILRGAATTVVMWPAGRPVFTPAGGPPAHVADLNTGRLSRRRVRGIAGCDCLPYLIGAGGRLVYVSAGGTAVIPADLAGEPRLLGTTPYFAPAAAPGHVWLIRYRGGVLGRAPVRASLVPVTGGPPGAAVTLPAGADELIRGTDAGLLLVVRHRRSSTLALWAPGSPPGNLPHSSGWDGLDATPLLVAYGTGCDPHGRCQTLRIFNVMTGRLISLPAPPGTAGWVPGGFDLVSAISRATR